MRFLQLDCAWTAVAFPATHSPERSIDVAVALVVAVDDASDIAAFGFGALRVS